MPPVVRRDYDRVFSWTYGRDSSRVPGRGAALIPVTWDGLALNTGDQDSGLFSIIENVTGWLDSPPLDGNDATRSIADGAAWGPKTLGPRTIVLDGAVTGQRDAIGWMRDQLAARAAARRPAELAITDDSLERTLVADVRADSEAYRQHWLSSTAFRWQVTLVAADPLLYERDWRTITLSSLLPDVETGRRSPREYGWRYAVPYLPNTGQLANAGNVDAPAWALYSGELSESRLTNEVGIVRLAALQSGMQIRVALATLVAEAEGGLSRASFVLPGSRPMVIPAASTSRFHLYSSGFGSCLLAWRSAFA